MRKRAEEALRNSEQRLQDIIDNTTAVIFVKDLELRYPLINREFERCHHVQRDEIRGKSDFDIHPRTVAEIVRTNDRQVIEAGAPIQFEECLPSDDGERSYISSKFLLRDGSGKPYAVCGIATDITERKRTELELRRTGEAIREAQKALTHVSRVTTVGELTASIALRGAEEQWFCDLQTKCTFERSLTRDGARLGRAPCELCGTGVEFATHTTIRVDLIKGSNARTARLDCQSLQNLSSYVGKQAAQQKIKVVRATDRLQSSWT